MLPLDHLHLLPHLPKAAHDSPRFNFLTHSVPSKLVNLSRIDPTPRNYGASQLPEPWDALVEDEVLNRSNWIHLGGTKVLTD